MKFLILAAALSCSTTQKPKELVREKELSCRGVFLQIQNYLEESNFEFQKGSEFNMSPRTHCAVFFHRTENKAKTVCSSLDEFKKIEENKITSCLNDNAAMVHWYLQTTDKQGRKIDE